MLPIHHGGTLPEMPESLINMYGSDEAQSQVVKALAELLRQGYADLKSGSRANVNILRDVG